LIGGRRVSDCVRVTGAVYREALCTGLTCALGIETEGCVVRRLVRYL